MLQLVLLQLGTDHAQTASEAGRTTADILLPWHIVEMDPGPIGAGHDALRPQDDATLFGVVQTRQSRVDLLFRVLTGRLSAPADEDIVGIMVMAAGATTVVMMVVFMFVMVMIVVMLMFMLIVVMVMMLVFMLMSIMVMVLIVIVMMVVMMVMLMFLVMCSLLSGEAGKLFLQRILVFHRLQDELAVELIPRCRDDGSVGIVFPQQCHSIHQFFLTHAVRTAEDDSSGMLDLVIKELTKVLHVNFALGRISHGDKGVQLNIMVVQTLHSSDDVRQLTYAGRLDKDTVGMELGQNLLQCLPKVTHQATTDAA